jgi:hypothetical protein
MFLTNKDISMNSTVINRLILLVSVSTAAFSLEAMFFHPMNVIERMLVVKEIQKRGADAVRQDINSAKDPETVIMHDGRYAKTYPMVLHVEMTLKKEDSESDELTKATFEKIEEIELKHGYIPAQIIKDTDLGYFVTPATNRLGEDTRYYWLEENGTLIPAVRIEAKLTNKPELKKIIAGYKQ